MEILNQLIIFFTDYGYLAVFMVLVACGFGVPIPEDITLVAGGVICGLTPGLSVHFMLLVALAGVLVGDGCMFLAGRLLGPRVKQMPLLRRVFTDNIYHKMQEKVHRYGTRILFVARFLPGLRAPIYITAGISHKVTYWKFLLMDGSAAVISVPIWVYAGFYFAYDLNHLLRWIHEGKTVILSVLVFFIVVYILYVFMKKMWNKTR